MAGGVEREDVFAAAKELGWAIETKPNGKGYLKLRCPCGKHLHWLHKTPSNPNYYREFIKQMHRACG